MLPFCAGQSANVFQRLVSYPVTTAGAVVATADFNGDGKLDVIVEDGNTAAAKVFFGNGDGTLTFHSDLTLPIGTAWVAPGDVNGDGITDLATAQFGSAKVTVLLGNGDGSFHMGYQYSGTFASSSIIMADLNHDGEPDLITAADDGTVAVFIAVGNGNFLPPVPRDRAKPSACAPN